MKEPNRLVNIGRGQRNLRYISAGFAFLAALVLAVFLFLSGANHLWRLLVYLPLAVGASAFYEAQEQVCSLLASRGECSLDQGFYLNKTIRGEKIDDRSLVEQLRRQGLRIAWRSQLVAIAVTLLFVIAPF